MGFDWSIHNEEKTMSVLDETQPIGVIDDITPAIGAGTPPPHDDSLLADLR
jgi:hypothetical protein